MVSVSVCVTVLPSSARDPAVGGCRAVCTASPSGSGAAPAAGLRRGLARGPQRPGRERLPRGLRKEQIGGPRRMPSSRVFEKRTHPGSKLLPPPPPPPVPLQRAAICTVSVVETPRILFPVTNIPRPPRSQVRVMRFIVATVPGNCGEPPALALGVQGRGCRAKGAGVGCGALGWDAGAQQGAPLGAHCRSGRRGSARRAAWAADLPRLLRTRDACRCPGRAGKRDLR